MGLHLDYRPHWTHLSSLMCHHVPRGHFSHVSSYFFWRQRSFCTRDIQYWHVYPCAFSICWWFKKDCAFPSVVHYIHIHTPGCGWQGRLCNWLCTYRDNKNSHVLLLDWKVLYKPVFCLYFIFFPVVMQHRLDFINKTFPTFTTQTEQDHLPCHWLAFNWSTDWK